MTCYSPTARLTLDDARALTQYSDELMAALLCVTGRLDCKLMYCTCVGGLVVHLRYIRIDRVLLSRQENDQSGKLFV